MSAALRTLPAAIPASAGELAATPSAELLAADKKRPHFRFGRYVLLEKIGAGGMGVVYAAHDAELNRIVAVKMLRLENSGSDCGSQASLRTRLIREARALAKLSHPHVVAVYDAGVIDGHVFLAMELIHGGSLRQWLRESPRTWRDIVQVMTQAASGLAAAHSAGLVHRDFKPDNVLIDGHNTALVADFGLATDPHEHDRIAPVEGLRSAKSPDVRIDTPALGEWTRAGDVMGTPVYMSPEQHRGERVTVQSDLFSFCVTLYEALYGEVPFRHTVSIGQVDVASFRSLSIPRSGTPRWLQAVLARGLALEPEQRFASMDDLIEALGQGQQRQKNRRSAAWAMGGLLAFFGAVLAAMPDETSCLSGIRRMQQVWHEDAMRRGEQGFLATQVPHAAQMWQRVQAKLDAYAEQWRDVYSQTCRANDQRKIDRQAQCLALRLTEMSALVVVLDQPTPQVVDQAVYLTDRLKSVEPCEHVVLTQALPTGDSEQAQAMRSELAAIAVLLSVDPTRPDHLRRLSSLVEQSLTASDPQVQIEVGQLAGDHAMRLRDYRQANAYYERNLSLALAHRDDQAASYAANRLMVSRLDSFERIDQSQPLLRAAQASNFRSGRDPLLEADLFAQQSALDVMAGRYEVGIATQRKAYDLYVKVRGPMAEETTSTLFGIGFNLLIVGRDDEALAVFEQLRRVGVASLGDRHPLTHRWWIHQAIAQAFVGKPEQAQLSFEDVIAVRQAAYGPESPQARPFHHPHYAWHLAAAGERQLAADFHRRCADNVTDVSFRMFCMYHEAILRGEMGQVSRAKERLADFLALDRQYDVLLESPVAAGSWGGLMALAADDVPRAQVFLASIRPHLRHPDPRRWMAPWPVGNARTALQVATLLSRLGEHEQALDFFGRTLTLAPRESFERHPLLTSIHREMGIASFELGRFEQARHHLEHGLAVGLAIWGEGHHVLTDDYLALGRLYRALGYVDQAQGALKQALALYRPDQRARHIEAAIQSELAALRVQR